MLALIAGSGGLPAQVLEAATGPVVVAALEGGACEVPLDLTFRIEHLGSFIADLVARGVTEVCFAGAVSRPPIDPGLIDAATLPLVPRMMQAIQAGDNAALMTVAQIFEEAGIALKGAHDVASNLLPPEGLLAGPPPDSSARADMTRARAVLDHLSSLDVGQACVARRGQILAIEALPGTDWMLESLKSPGVESRGAVMVKTPKTDQDLRLDMPTIGAQTLRRAADLGLAGIMITQGNVIVLDRAEVIQIADDAGVFVMVAPK